MGFFFFKYGWKHLFRVECIRSSTQLLYMNPELKRKKDKKKNDGNYKINFIYIYMCKSISWCKFNQPNSNPCKQERNYLTCFFINVVRRNLSILLISFYAYFMLRAQERVLNTAAVGLLIWCCTSIKMLCTQWWGCGDTI